MRDYLRVVRYYRMCAAERREAWLRGPRWVGVLPLVALTAALLLVANAGEMVALALGASNPGAILTSAHIRNILLLGALSTLEMVGALLIARRLTPTHLIGGAVALREAARRGDEEVAPAVLHQPPPLDVGSLSQVAPLGPFESPADGRDDEETLRAEALLVVATLATGTAIYLTIAVGWSGWSRAAIMGLATLGAILLVQGAWVAVRARRFAAPVSVTVLPNGLSFRHQGQRRAQNILWAQARSFAALGYRYGAQGKQYRIYLLDTGDGALAWGLPADADITMATDSGLLCQVIRARTGLPMRDISIAAASLATSSKSKGAPIVGTDDAATMIEAPDGRRRMDGALAVALLPLLLAAVASGVALALRRLL